MLQDFLRWLPVARPDWKWTAYLLPPTAREFADPAEDSRRAIEYVPLGDSGAGRIVWLYRELPRRLRAAGADVLFSVANIAAPGGGVPNVVYLHQALAFPDPGAPRGPLGRRIRLLTLRYLILLGARKSESIVVQTEDMKRRLGNYDAGLPGRTRVIPGCVSASEGDEEIRESKRAEIDESGWPCLLYVAAATIQKNHAALLRAMPAIAARFPEVRLLLTLDEGSDPGGREYVTNLRQLTAELGIRRHVVWMGGLRRPEVRYALAKASLAVFPSLEESFGIPLAEAIVAGCPLAASDLAYAHEVAGSAAVYFDPTDPNSIASVAIATLERPEVLAGLRAEQARRASRFDPRNVAEEIARCIEDAATPTIDRRAISLHG